MGKLLNQSPSVHLLQIKTQASVATLDPTKVRSDVVRF